MNIYVFQMNKAQDMRINIQYVFPDASVEDFSGVLMRAGNYHFVPALSVI